MLLGDSLREETALGENFPRFLPAGGGGELPDDSDQIPLGDRLSDRAGRPAQQS